jgi:hypothetical protein
VLEENTVNKRQVSGVITKGHVINRHTIYRIGIVQYLSFAQLLLGKLLFREIAKLVDGKSCLWVASFRLFNALQGLNKVLESALQSGQDTLRNQAETTSTHIPLHSLRTAY